MDALADGGRFTVPSMSPWHSALNANFYEAMLWYAKEKQTADNQALLAQQNTPHV